MIEEIVMVPVPREHLGEVYELLGQLMGPYDRESLSARVTDGAAWSEVEITQLARVVKNHTLLAMLDVIAEREGEEIEYRELKRLTDKRVGEKSKLGSFRAQLSWLMKYARRIKRAGGDVWPLRRMIKGEKNFYSMTRTTAELWRRARAG